MKNQLRQAMDSLQEQIDSFGKIIDSVHKNSNPMEAELRLRQVKEQVDSVFDDQVPMIEKKWQETEWTVKEKDELIGKWKRLVHHHMELSKKLAEGVFTFQKEQAKQRALGANDSAAVNDRSIYEQMQTNLDQLQTKMNHEKDSLYKEAERVHNILIRKIY